MPPLCKGRWLAWQDGGVVKVIFLYKTIPHPTPSGAPFTQGRLFCSPMTYQIVVFALRLNAAIFAHCFMKK